MKKLLWFPILCLLFSCTAEIALNQDFLEKPGMESWMDILSSSADPLQETIIQARDICDSFHEREEGYWFVLEAGTEGEREESGWVSLVVALPFNSNLEGMAVFLLLMEDLAVTEIENSIAFFLVQSSSAIGQNQFADPGSSKILVLDHEMPFALRTASYRHLCPYYYLKSARAVLKEKGLEWHEDWADGLLARLGINNGMKSLQVWHVSSFSALGMGMGLADSQILVALASEKPQWLHSEDLNYLRFPLPFGLLDFPDHISAIFSLLFMSMILLYAWLHRKRRESLQEAIIAFFLVFGAIGIASLAARLFSFAYQRLFEIQGASMWPGMILRTVSSGLVYYALSGFASRLGFLPIVARISGMHGAAILFSMGGFLSIFFAPALTPFLLFFALLSLLASRSIPLSILGLLLALGVSAPWLFYLVMPDSTAALEGVLKPGLFSISILTLAIAPLSLWLASAFSPGNKLARAKKPAPYIAVLAFILLATEPLIEELVKKIL